MEAPLLHLALVGTPNSGKTSLFNALTGSRQKVANYPGVTVERKEGFFVTPQGRQVSVVDLPGTYSLRGRSPDEEITRDMVLGRTPGEALPDLVLCVADSTNLRLTIRLLLELKNTGRPHGAGAQHVRHRDPARRHRGCAKALGGARRSRRHLDRGAQGRHRRSAETDGRHRGKGSGGAAAKSVAAAHGGAIARDPARGRPHHRRQRQPADAARHLDSTGRCGGAASRRRTCDPRADPVRDVPGGVCLGAAADGVVCRRASARSGSSCTTRCRPACCRAFCRTA